MSLSAFSPMGDSDDEFDRRRRDKFRRERSDMERSREREDRRRDDWQDRWAHLDTHTHTCSPVVMQQGGCVSAGSGTGAETGGGTMTVVGESGSLPPDTSARSTNA